jgi:hypothetical protein
MEVKYGHGDPRLSFLDASGKVIKVESLNGLKRNEIVELLATHRVPRDEKPTKPQQNV